jgi:hypothetical protein
MSLGSQQANVDLISALTGLTHDIFVGQVENDVKRESKTAMLFQEAGKGDYRLEGQNMVFATDLRFKTGALGTDGKLPDHVPMDAVQGKITPIRRYARLAVDNFVEKRASGPGAFEDLAQRIFDQLWDSWASMEIRHSIGDSTGLVCKCSSRTSSTVVVLKSGYGNSGTNPIQHLSEGSIIGWYDVSAVGVGGSGKISSIDYVNNTITMASATTWEPSAQIAADDLIYFATTTDSTKDYFTLERNLAPNGVGTIVDPAAAATTVFNIAEGTYQRWKPFRKASVTFDHLEVTEFWLKLAAKRGFDVTAGTDVALSHPAPIAQLARSLMGFQMNASYSGGNLDGGYSGVRIANVDFVQDHFFYHNAMVTLNKERLYRVPLGAQADFWGEDGSMWQRIMDYDGKEAFVVDYVQFFSNHRGANGALTGISTPDVTTADFDAVPNY